MSNTERGVAKERFWRDALQRHASSGLDVRAFCRQDGLSEASFYAWRRTIRERNGEALPGKRAPAFVPMVVRDQPERARSIAIELAGGRVLRLPESISTERLVELIHALEASSAR